MTIFTIIGWITVIGFAGSLLYSTQFHLRNYLTQRKRINTGEVGEIYAEGHGAIKWRSLIYMQLFKLAIIFVLIFFLTKSSGSEPTIDNDTNSGWTEEIKQQVFEGCIGSQPIKRLTSVETEEYCKCVLEKTMLEYPNPDDMGDYLPDAFVRRATKECLVELGIME